VLRVVAVDHRAAAGGVSERAPLRATYRLQLGTDLDFARAAELVPYVADLGCSHLYLSPSFQAREGSTHGYDVIDPGRVSDALGGESGLRALADVCHEHGMGIILDVVPNHMATDDGNRFWADPELREQFFDVDPVSGRWRRFFDIDELAGVRMEDPEVFHAVSDLALRLVREGVIDGLRVDHPDGLANPREYLDRLREGGAEHVWVEKILDPGECLRSDWVVEGTVGYEFANDVAALFVDPAAEEPLTELYESLVDDPRPFGEVAEEAKREQARTSFRPEVERLARLWPDAPDLAEAVSALPIYRTYVEPELGHVDAADREALANQPDAIRAVLTLDDAGSAPSEFVTRFQQTTPAVMAKGVEDTAFYRYTRLLALNEVGGDPSRFGITADQFHAANAARLPHNLLVSSTHDTKRTGDVRARLVALTWMADEWAGAVRSWFEVNEPLRTGARPPAPTPSEELLIYQTLVATWPIEPERLEAYLEKALREAKQSSNWIEPDEQHEAAVRKFAVGLIDHGPFRYGFDVIADRVAEIGARISLAQTLLKLTVPGLPDTYQGDELWKYALVDPDNRRPVDWAAHASALAALRDGAPPTSETAKLHLTTAALDLRRRRPESFATNNYTKIETSSDIIAFLRGDVLVATSIRDTSTGTTPWDLPPSATGTWHDVLSGETYDLPTSATLSGILGPTQLALLERV
jgi:(1->4)-alpha-D-glucan 1-alpha-D-glucosylmutase